VKYKGRTGIQTTGKKNYARLTELIGVRDGVDFVKNPEKLSENKYFVEGACVYWNDNKLNGYADAHKFAAIQGIVNRGSATKEAKDYAKRLTIYNAALSLLPDDFNLSDVTDINVADIPQTLKKGDKGADVREMQERLVGLGYMGNPDGIFGTMTEKAVQMFQGEYGLREDGIAGTQTLAKIQEVYEEKTGTKR